MHVTAQAAKRAVLAFTLVISLIPTSSALTEAQTQAAFQDTTETTQEDTWYSWKEKDAPNYVKVIGDAQVSDAPEAGEVEYEDLDEYDRTAGAKAVITYEMVEASAGWRQDIPESEDPSGWGHNGEVAIVLPTGKTYHGWFWNRSHLIADSLGGDAIEENLITGTRMQNVGANNGEGGMAYCETKVRDWIEDNHDGTVYYAATPVYEDDELVPRNVIVDMKSSDGEIDERVVVFNYAKGYTINYNKGTYKAKKGAAAATSKSSEKSDSSASKSSGSSSSGNSSGKSSGDSSKNGSSNANKGSSGNGGSGSSGNSSSKTYCYVTPTGSKYHNEWCPTLSRSKHLTKLTVSAAKSRGYEACKVCH